MTDPRAIVDRTTYDLLGRTAKTVEAYTDGTPSAADDRTTEYTYTASGDVLTMKAVLPSSAFQETKYIYGEADKSVSGITRSGSTATATSTAHGYRVGESVTVSGAAQAEYNGMFVITAVTSNTFSYTVTGTPVSPATGTITVRRAHGLYSNDVLTAVQYPDKTTGSSSNSEQESFTVNALGERTHYIDRNGSVHAYSYDVLGRMTADHVTAFGAGVDTVIDKLGYTYDTAGRPEKFTSYTATTGIRNEVQRVYNGLGQLITEYQDRFGAVSTSTSPKVQYAYSELTGGNHSRLKSVTYPNGRILRYEYSSGLDDSISRLSFLADDSSGSVGTHLEEYSYLGLGTVIKRAHPQSGVDLTYIKQGAEGNGDAGDQYTGLDRFGRVVDQRWRKTSDGSHTDRFGYGYDRNSNRLYEENLVDTTKSELYHGGGGYDSLDRLTSFSRGTLDAEKDGISGSASRTQTWTLDALGNWSSISTNGTPQSRTHDKQNQITAMIYDGNGNLVDDSGFIVQGITQTYLYDAWNRLVVFDVDGDGDTNAVIYQYDALGRRIHREAGDSFGGDETVFFYSTEWQVLEEQDEDTNVKAQNVWSPVYVDAMVLRDRDTDANGSLDERLYAQHDANFNVTALVNTSGTVVERYVYDPYGAASVLDANWAADADGISDVGWVYLHQGGRYDTAAGLYHFNNGGNGRHYSPTIGRWVQQDRHLDGPYVDGMSAYQYVRSNPTTLLDPNGGQSSPGPIVPPRNPMPGLEPPPGEDEFEWPGKGYVPPPPPFIPPPADPPPPIDPGAGGNGTFTICGLTLTNETGAALAILVGPWRIIFPRARGLPGCGCEPAPPGPFRPSR